MKIFLQPLYCKLNPGVEENCPLGCRENCRVMTATPEFKPPFGCSCPLYAHQAFVYKYLVNGSEDVLFLKAPTGTGKSLAAYLPSYLDPNFRLMALYPTIELIEDQYQQQKYYHRLFGLNAEEKVDLLFGLELAKRIKEFESNRFQELLFAIQTKPLLLTNPDIFHLITHFRYRDPAYSKDLLPINLAQFPDLWAIDEFHIFGEHQETALLNSMSLIRRMEQKTRRFLFTSATPKAEFIGQLKQAGLKVAEIEGEYANTESPGYRQVSQPIELEFIELKEGDACQWLKNFAVEIAEILKTETRGRALIILNSVANVRRAVFLLSEELPEVIVREVSGRIDRRSRVKTAELLKEEPRPVLIVATSAVDVGVDFKIHLLIIESSNSATVIQRLGRLGRHPGFCRYQAFILISRRQPWVIARLETELQENKTITRQCLQNAITIAFDPPFESREYRERWGALQTIGILTSMSQDNPKVMSAIEQNIERDLEKVYGKELAAARKEWYALDSGIQEELLRFRGSSSLQTAVADEKGFYTYDLLRLLPYASVEIINREPFLQLALAQGWVEEAFQDKYIQVYLRIDSWLEKRLNISLFCNRDREELKVGGLFSITGLKIFGQTQSEVTTCISQKKILCFLIPIDRLNKQSHWQVSRHLGLSPLFGLYRLEDAGGNAYACAFNQDALMLEGLKSRLGKFFRRNTSSSIF